MESLYIIFIYVYIIMSPLKWQSWVAPQALRLALDLFGSKHILGAQNRGNRIVWDCDHSHLFGIWFNTISCSCYSFTCILNHFDILVNPWLAGLRPRSAFDSSPPSIEGGICRKQPFFYFRQANPSPLVIEHSCLKHQTRSFFIVKPSTNGP